MNRGDDERPSHHLHPKTSAAHPGEQQDCLPVRQSVSHSRRPVAHKLRTVWWMAKLTATVNATPSDHHLTPSAQAPSTDTHKGQTTTIESGGAHLVPVTHLN